MPQPLLSTEDRNAHLSALGESGWAAVPDRDDPTRQFGLVATLKRVLAEYATHLSRFDEHIYDAGELLGMALEQAGNSRPQSLLEQTIDASSPATGLPLFFGRAFPQPLAGRFRLGTLGRGWFTPWEITATQSFNLLKPKTYRGASRLATYLLVLDSASLMIALWRARP